ncbi:uncharacterized protein SOCEGT47_003660 [Sorangium cellulosum]|uniref:Uncharacterized protein n=1 Tax=Sorangium cellulosum TaxID=56 RepID=A0A4V0NCP7_SORCE|nr:hypothetical protein [Sorangium cellulosum]AUX19912.1 uncharacterized protein SOCEGT47_003660 [Sorangium cellulosum]
MSQHRPSLDAFSGQLSDRAKSFFAREHIFRDLSNTCSFERLAEELDRRGAPWFDKVFELEEEFGGLVRRGPHPKTPSLAIGLFQLISLGFDAPGEEEPEDDSALVSLKWPMVRLAATGDLLTHVGVYTTEADLYLSESGWIFWYVSTLDRVELLSGSASTFLERVALEDHVRRTMREYAGTFFTADEGSAIAQALNIPVVEEASDALITHWMNPNLFISRLPRTSAPGIYRTRIVSRTVEALLSAAQAVITRSPEAQATVETHLPGGRERHDALRREGVAVGG